MRINTETSANDTSGGALSQELAELLVLVASKDQLALQDLYRKTSAQLFAVLLNLFGNHREAAEDALQETYVKIWIHAGSYQETISQPLTWMTSIARNHALDVLRSENYARNRNYQYAISINVDCDDTRCLVEVSAANNQLLNYCLHRLHPQTQSLVMDAYCSGYTHQELSQKTNIPLGTVKSSIRRAIVTMKRSADELS